MENLLYRVREEDISFKKFLYKKPFFSLCFCPYEQSFSAPGRTVMDRLSKVLSGRKEGRPKRGRKRLDRRVDWPLFFGGGGSVKKVGWQKSWRTEGRWWGQEEEGEKKPHLCCPDKVCNVFFFFNMDKIRHMRLWRPTIKLYWIRTSFTINAGDQN